MIDDSSLEEILYSRCMRCRHYDMTTEIHATNRCAAFSDGIPAEIWSGENLHAAPLQGDRGIRFEAVR